VKLAFIYPPRLVGGRPVDFTNVWGSGRGLTGSETNLLVSARELAALGHEVGLLVEAPNALEWEGVKLLDLRGCEGGIGGGVPLCDAVIVGFDVDYLRLAAPGPLRVVLQQCNDFSFAKPDFRDFVDLYILPSHAHVRSQTDPAVRPELAGLGGYLPADKCEVQPNGVFLEDFDSLGEVAREPGLCVHSSSPDRALHIVLQEWVAIKRAVPHARLEVFYYSLESYRQQFRGQHIEGRGLWQDFAGRSQYIDHALRELAPFGVRAIGPVSRKALALRLRQAELLLYPADPVQWTESFGCAVLEGCAAGALPIISDVDAFGEIFGGACPMVRSPAIRHAAEWRDMVITRLKNPGLVEMERKKARALAERLTWQHSAKVLEEILLRRGKHEKRAPYEPPAVRRVDPDDPRAVQLREELSQK
jgi:glycosyltransferase involved in cell wall biosynthesis